MRPDILLLSEATLKDRTVVNNNVDPKFIQQCIWTVQEMQIHPALGTMLYNRIIEGIKNNDLKEEEKSLLDDYITNAMVFYVMAELPTVLGFKFHNKNVLKQQNDNAESASMSEIATLITHYKNKAEFFIERMKRFLLQGVVENKFPEYININGKIDTILPKRRSYTCGLVLDDDQELPNVRLGYGEGIRKIR